MKGTLIGLLVCLLIPTMGWGEPSITLYAKHNGAPKHFQDENGMARGYAVEIALEALRRAGYSPSAATRPWSRAQIEAMEGKGLITAFSKTSERLKAYLFSEAMYSDRVVLVQRRDRAIAFTQYEDLIPLNIGIARGSTYSGQFSQYESLLTLERDDGHIQRLKKLLAGRIDAAIFPGDQFLVRYNAWQANLDPAVFVVADKAISKDPNYIGIPKTLKGHDPVELKAKLEKAIIDMKEDGSIQSIRLRYSDF